MSKITTYNPKLSDQTTPYTTGKFNVQDGIEIKNAINDNDTRIGVLEQGGGGGTPLTKTQILELLEIPSISGVNTGDQSLAGLMTQADFDDFYNDYTAFVTANQATLNGKLPTATFDSFITAYNGAISLKADLVGGKVPASQLPSYVDDVLEFANLAAFPATGETGKIYIAIDTEHQYRWTGSTYIELVQSPGTTDNVPEGNVNKYYTDGRVAAAPSVINKVLQTDYNANKLTTDAAIAAATPLLQVETQDYVKRIVIAGGTLDPDHTNAIDKFVIAGKRDGWYSAIKMFAPIAGSNLNAAFVKLVTESGGSNIMVNHNLSASEYDPQKGFTITTLGTTGNEKWVDMGIIPFAQGLSKSNIGMGFFQSDYTSTITGFLLGDNPTTGAPNIYVANTGSLGVLTRASSTGAPGKRMQFFNIPSATAYNIYYNGIIANSTTGAASLTGDITTPLSLFKVTNSGTASYSLGTISAFMITSGLTDTQAASLNLAFYKLYQGLGRISTVGGVGLFLGDSIAAGVGPTLPTDRWSTIVASALGLIEFNQGVPSGELSRNQPTSPYATSVMNRYLNLKNFDFNTAVLMIGTNDLDNNDNVSTGDPAKIATYQTNLGTVIQFLKDKGARVIVCSPPYNAFAPIARQQAYWAAASATAFTKSVTFVDLGNSFYLLPNPNTYFPDNIHPGTPASLIMANHIVAAIQGKAFQEPTLDFSSIAAGASATLTVPMLGARFPMSVSLGITPLDGIRYEAWVSANDVVTVKATNTTTSAIDPPSQVVRVTVNLT
jgi:lysophospholipase L1-like esterase